MRTRRPFIPQRKPIFIGCEGESEQGYAGFLQDLIHEADLHVHLNIELLRAGDPLSRIELAVRKLAQLQRSRGSFPDRFVLLDTDQLALSHDRAQRALHLAAEHGIKVVWQEPCFEAMLLRHFAGKTADRPPDNQTTQAAILHEWPQYRKATSRADLARKIDLDAVIRAAGVEGDLMALLRCIGLIKPEESAEE
jgi:RloB-like protein